METTRTATQVIPILGDPVAQVATPALWNEVFRARGQDAVCVPLDLPAAGWHRSWSGCAGRATCPAF